MAHYSVGPSNIVDTMQVVRMRKLLQYKKAKEKYDFDEVEFDRIWRKFDYKDVVPCFYTALYWPYGYKKFVTMLSELFNIPYYTYIVLDFITK